MIELEENHSPLKPKVLVIEDDGPIRKFLHASLAGGGYDCVEASTGEEGLRQAAAYQPDIILLDLGLPDRDGLEIIRELREWSQAPIVVLSAREREGDKVAALDAGSDDYLTKPFGVGELLARLRVALRHTLANTNKGKPIFRAGPLVVDLAKRRVHVDSREIHLTPIEYKLLIALVRHPDKVVTHRQLLKEVWGPGSQSETHYLRVYMGHLRHKIEADPARPKILTTEPGVGYRLVTE